MQLILVVVVIFFPVTVTTFLDKEQAADINKANELLQNMGGGRSTGPAEPSSSAASQVEGKDDGMDALRRAADEDAAQGKR